MVYIGKAAARLMQSFCPVHIWGRFSEQWDHGHTLHFSPGGMEPLLLNDFWGLADGCGSEDDDRSSGTQQMFNNCHFEKAFSLLQTIYGVESLDGSC